MSFDRFSTDDTSGKMRGYVGEGRFTDDPLHTSGGAGVVEIPNLQAFLHFICERGFERHVAANLSTVARKLGPTRNFTRYTTNSISRSVRATKLFLAPSADAHCSCRFRRRACCHSKAANVANSVLLRNRDYSD
jgi:hypothetical protein